MKSISAYNFTDEELVFKIVETNSCQLLALLYGRFYKAIYNRCYGFSKNKEEAEDLTHDVFIRLFTKLKTFKGNSKFSTWLFSIVYNTTISFLRKKQIHWEEINEDRVDYQFGSTETASDLFKSEERMKYINEALSKMGEQQQVLVQLFYLEELSMKEIEEITGIKMNSIKIGLMRARQNLLKHLSASLQGELKSLL